MDKGVPGQMGRFVKVNGVGERWKAGGGRRSPGCSRQFPSTQNLPLSTNPGLSQKRNLWNREAVLKGILWMEAERRF